MTLTEQLKKGELDTGWYYLKTEKETSIGLYYEAFGHKIWTLRPMENVEEVLSVVPSYEEWQELSKQRNQLIRDVKDLAYIQEENAKLNKRLLDMMDLLQKSYFYLNAVADKKVKTEHLEQIKTLTVLIDNAIGENKEQSDVAED